MSDPRVRCPLKAFTLIELLITLALIGILVSLGLVLGMRARAKARAVTCLSNQQEISKALLDYYTDHGRLPADGPAANLALELSEQIPWPEGRRCVSLPETWRCPNDRSGPLHNSYEPYYVQRHDPNSSEYFVLGCPRHDDAGESYINLQGVQALRFAKPGRILLNGRAVSPEAPEQERSINSGTMRFEDGSTATITESGDDLRLTALASFRKEDGTLYTIVRITGKGKADYSVRPGSRFEVVTPVAIIGVRGTEFDVEVDADYTKTTVSSGMVEVWDRTDWSVYYLSPGESMEVGPPVPPTSTTDKRLSFIWISAGKWRVVNPNTFSVWYSWTEVDGDEAGVGVVQAQKHTYIVYNPNRNPDSARVNYSLPELGPQMLVLTTPDSYLGD